MTCNFTYLLESTKSEKLTSPSWEGLVLLLLAVDPKLMTFNELLTDNLTFYHADIPAVLDLLEKDEKKNLGKKVTKYIKDNIAEVNKLKDELEYRSADLGQAGKLTEKEGTIYINYRQELGTNYHNCIDALKRFGGDSKEYNDAVQRLWETISKYKPFTQSWKTISDLTSVRNAISFLDNITSEQLYKNLILPNSLSKIEETLKKYGDYRTEVRIQEESADINRGVTGIIDAITWDGSGNIIIWDFKTTANSDVSKSTKLYRYLLLCLYKEILVRYAKDHGINIPIDNILLKTLLITDSIINGNEPTLEVKVIDPESAFENDTSLRKALNDARRLLDQLYPPVGKAISEEESTEKKNKIARLTQPILSDLGITTITKDALENYLLKLIDNKKTVFLHHLQENDWKKGITVTDWKKEGDMYVGYDASGKLVIRDTISNIALKEADVLREALHQRTRNIAEGLNTKSYNSIKNLFKFKEDNQKSLLLALEPYLSEEYEYLKIDFLEDNYNIITLRNRASNTYTFLVISDLVSLDHQRKEATNILTPVFNDQSILKKFKEAKNLPTPSAENIFTLLAMAAISECASLLSDEPIKLDKILVVSASSGYHSSGLNISRFTDAFKLLEYQANNNPNSLKDPDAYKDINTTWNLNILIQDQEEVLKRLVLNRISTYKLTNPDAALDGLSSLQIENILENINDVLEGLEKDYNKSQLLDLNTQIGRIYAGLKQLKHKFLSGEVYDKLYKHTRFALTAAETLGAGLDLLKYAESRRYSFNGMILNGIALGLDTSVSYSNPDKAVQFYEQMFRNAARLVSVELGDLALQVNLATKKFLREAGKSQFSLVVSGNTTDAYEALFEQENSQVARNMQLKNPYSNFSELTPWQKEYVEEILWSINRLRMTSLIGDEYKKMSYEEFKKSNLFKYYKELVLNNARYLEMPLKLKNSTEGLITNIRNFFDPDDDEKGTRTRVEKFCRNIADRWQQSIQPVLLTPDQVSEIDLDINESTRDFEYHSPYNKQGENRVIMLNNTPVNEWEKNLNILTLEYACAQLKEKYFQQVLPTVGNLLGEIDLMEVMTGKDLSDTKLALVDRMRISIYNQNLVPPELKTASSVIAGMKLVVSLTKLALRPATFIKEMILGVLRNSSTIITLNFINDVPITFDHLRQAAGVVYTNGLFINNGFAPNDETFGDFRLVGALNNLYRINDRDLNLLGESLSYDSHGIMHWGSRMLYLNTTAPDWFNRMTLVVAKMMADGTWEAHSLDADGRLIYDPFKDKRFAKFLSFYRRHDGDLTNEPTDEEYVMAKARYTLTVEQLLKEGYTDLKANDGDGYSIIPVCYTEQEMSSVKEQIGMLYGYYSHEERSTILKSIWWLLHTLFLTFWPGEIKKYFASGNMESTVGRVVHATEPFTGKKLYYIQNEAGLTEVVNEDELTSEQKTRPVLEFTKTPLEGLIVSSLKTMSLIWHGDRANIPKELWDRTKLFIFNALIAALISALVAGAGILIAKEGKASREDKRLMDATAANLRILRSVALELNVFDIMESSISQLGITGYDGVKQILSSTMSNITSSSRDWFDVLNLVGAIKDFLIS